MRTLIRERDGYCESKASLREGGGPRPGFPEANLQSLGGSRRSGGRSTRPYQFAIVYDRNGRLYPC